MAEKQQPVGACVVCGQSKESTKVEEDLSFHRCGDSAILSTWYYELKLGQRLNWYPQLDDVVCSKHFAQDMYILDEQGKVVLHENAYPCVEYYLEEDEVTKQFGNVPTVLKVSTDTWPAMDFVANEYNWTEEKLANKLGDKKLNFRLGRHNHKDIQYETDCSYVWATIRHFHEWLQCSSNVPEDHPFAKFCKLSYWCYADYIYLRELFSDVDEMFEDVKWSTLGLPNRNGYESTFWMGTPGSYTVAHYDTYGCNLVAQIVGKKRWIMFPPEQTPYLYPTRVPYEESSVFSRVNIRYPDVEKFPNFKLATPYVIDLCEGDVLFVPKHWWHFVECLPSNSNLPDDTATISVNTWIPLESDAKERGLEAVAKYMITNSFLTPENSKWLINPSQTEEMLERQWNLKCLSKAMNDVPSASTDDSGAGDGPPPAKKTCLYRSPAHSLPRYPIKLQSNLRNEIKNYVQRFTFEEYITAYCQESELVTGASGGCQSTDKELNLQDVIDSCLDREVLSLISDKLQKKLKNR